MEIELEAFEERCDRCQCALRRGIRTELKGGGSEVSFVPVLGAPEYLLFSPNVFTPHTSEDLTLYCEPCAQFIFNMLADELPRLERDKRERAAEAEKEAQLLAALEASKIQPPEKED
jgi:hypothetical protein